MEQFYPFVAGDEGITVSRMQSTACSMAMSSNEHEPWTISKGEPREAGNREELSR